MQSKKTMGNRKKEKITALLVGTVVICLSFSDISNWAAVGIYAGCGIRERMFYPFFHANILHAVLNVWCLLSLVFIYEIKIWRMLLSYLIAITIPIGMLSSIVGGMLFPTVGLSGIIFALFGTISFEIVRKWYYQGCMVCYLLVGFLFPNTNAWLHLYCYLFGFLIALMNKPIKVYR